MSSHKNKLIIMSSFYNEFIKIMSFDSPEFVVVNRHRLIISLPSS